MVMGKTRLYHPLLADFGTREKVSWNPYLGVFVCVYVGGGEVEMFGGN
jgi:hypothetical protein